ncbi:MAG: DUF1269 domain-containing protein [Candidatus Promineifilaceae bacterium]|nr:DUF1269 domain-containing protein [Candidatus Promineifilaceae bacterium]
MSEVPVEVIVAAFQSEDGAKQALSELKKAKRQGLIKIDDAAVIRKDAKGKLHIKETADMSTGKGAGIGAVIGGVVGLLAGPIGIGLGAAAGAAIGGMAAHGDAGIKDERLETIGAGLEPETSAIVAIVEHKWVAEVQKALEEEATDIMAQRLSADIHEQLTSGKELAYSAITAEGAASVSRTVGDEHEVEQENLTITEDSVSAEKIVANEEGVTASRYVATDEGEMAQVTTITEDGAATEAVLVTDEAVEVIEAAVTDEGAAVIDAVVTEDDAIVTAAVITPDDDGDEEAAPETNSETNEDEESTA